MKRPNLKSARAAMNLAAVLEYRTLKEEQDMANRKTAKKKYLKEQKRKEEAQRNVQSLLQGGKK